jgi:hypothetical protein
MTTLNDTAAHVALTHDASTATDIRASVCSAT